MLRIKLGGFDHVFFELEVGDGPSDIGQDVFDALRKANLEGIFF